jgi:hypothetical protein
MKRDTGGFFVFGFFTLLALACVGALVLQGCATTSELVKDPVLTNAYQTLNNLNTAYDIAWGSFADLYKQGLVKDETMVKAKAMAWKYYDNWQKAAKTLKAYASGTASEDQVKNILDLARAGLDELKAYLKEQAGDNLKVI